MNFSKLGESLFSLGGVLLAAGFILLKFPNIFKSLSSLPGNININGKFIFPVGTIMAIGFSLAIVSLLFGLIAKLIR